jgi:hypothetical protein
VLFDGSVDVRVFVQAELADDVDGEVLHRHLPVVDEAHEDLRPLFASGHDAQRVLAQGLVTSDLAFPAEQESLGDAFVVELGRGLQDAAFEAGRVGGLQNGHHGHHSLLFAEFGQGLRDGDAGGVGRFGVGPSSLRAFLSASAFPLRSASVRSPPLCFAM